jgi:hypothetical protein
MASCKDPMEIALRIINEDAKILKGLNNGSKKIRS